MNNITLEPIYQIPIFNGKEEITSELVHTWYLGEHEVTLLKEGDKLFFQVLDNNNKRLIKENEVTPIKIDENTYMPMDTWIWYLKQCEPILSDDFTPNFCPLKVEWSLGKINIKLLKLHDNRLMWRYFSSDLKRIMDIYFEKISLIPSANCHLDTALIIEKVLNEEEDPYLLRDFKIVSLGNLEHFLLQVDSNEDDIQSERRLLRNDVCNKTVEFVAIATMLVVFLKYTKQGKTLTSLMTQESTSIETGFGIIGGYIAYAEESLVPFIKKIFNKKNYLKVKNYTKNLIKAFQYEGQICIEIEPISAQSTIDPRVRVSKFTWGITLLTHGGSTGDHALAIVEGVNDGFYPEYKVEIGSYFRHKIEFDGVNILTNLFPLDKTLLYKTRSKVWMRSSKKVQAMINFIALNKNQPPVFSEYGRDSLFSKGADSCFTWLREQLRIADIYLSKSIFGFVITRTKNYTRKPEEYNEIPVKVKI